MRPANRPERRMEGMALFVGSLGGRGLIEAAGSAFAGPSPAGAAAFFDPAGAGLIGPGRAAELWTSAVLPALGARGAFSCWPALPESGRVRDARAALELDPPRTLRAQWGLLEWRRSQF